MKKNTFKKGSCAECCMCNVSWFVGRLRRRFLSFVRCNTLCRRQQCLL